MKKLLWIAPLLGVAALVWWGISLKNAPPEIRYATAATTTLVDTLNTNGKVEPVEWAAVRAERGGLVTQLRVERGQSVAAGAVLAELDTADSRTALAAAEARVAQIRAEMDNVKGGGRSAELAEIDSSVSRLTVEKRSAEQEFAVTQRLAARKAATEYEVSLLRDKVTLLDEQIRGLQARRGSLVMPGDRALLEGRLREAQTAVDAAREKIAQGVIRTPVGGVVYQLEPRRGSFLNPGDLVANVGRIERLRVSVYVDEPELGRVSLGMPVTVTWDADPSKTWEGRIDKLPVQIVALGSRQVGEVLVSIENADGSLRPGANINASVRSRVANNAVVLPKECLRRENGVSGVYVLEGAKAVWRPVRTGVTNITHVQILEGVRPGDHVALASDTPIHTGDIVTPVSADAAP